ncbi:MAG: NAD(P)/FAD-dependent oxidoreductase [Acidobacteria bacterium]|nr:NAD(P)/FAD-dependent oxidoreductase [Acidobacteriota bacterium]
MNNAAQNGATTLVIGAGPAGLTAALELSRTSSPCIVLESDGVVGGISRTVEHNGYRFDIGGHRFYTKLSVIQDLWREVLGDDFLTRPRLSRIYYNNGFFDYPLKAGNVLGHLGFLEAAFCVASYCKARMFPRVPEDCLEDWVVNRFGHRLYTMFFKSYTEKVWGISCREIHSAWAAQRIRGLSLLSAARAAIFHSSRPAAKSLIHEFHYPRHGPGMLWNRVAAMVRGNGGEVRLNSPVTRVHWTPGGVTGVEAGGRYYPAGHVLSTMPIRDLIRILHPAPPGYLSEAASLFHYRDFLTVALILRVRDAFPDNWIYVHDPSVKVGRIQNFKNWSPEMVPSDEFTCLGMEYFCFEADSLWSMSDEQLIRLAGEELGKLGLCAGAVVVDGAVVRTPKAYPVYDATYRRGLEAVRRFLAQTPNLQCIGRNGMHHYNNQDHSMLTGLLAARNILGANYDLWKVNSDEEYLEDDIVITRDELEALRETQPQVPVKRDW